MSSFEWLREAALARALPRAADLPSPPGESAVAAWETADRILECSPDELAAAVGAHFRLPVADLDTRDLAVLRLIPEAAARKYLALPLREEGRKLWVAVANPADRAGLQELEFIAGRYLEPMVAPGYRLASTISAVYGKDDPLAKLMAKLGRGSSKAVLVGTDGSQLHEAKSLGEAGDRTADLVSKLFQEAVALGSSDFHLEPMAGGAVARFRTDGVLGNAVFMPRDTQTRAVSHVKALAGMDPTARIRPQDGRARLFVGNHTFDLRISTLPADGGENMVVRLLGTAKVPGLEDVPFTEPERTDILRLFRNASGIVLITGPTGSGKTTTLYSAIQDANRPDVDIHTIEDPVEYRMPGVIQIQVNEKQGVTFASAIRSILRQDPDVLLVGEIRDAETAEAAKQAALTGHMVFSTLHTRDAPSALFRLVDLGVDHSYLAEVLEGVVAQRLVRVLCEQCAAEVTEPDEDEKRFQELTGTAVPRRAAGCTACESSGYRGRRPITQVFTVTQEVKDLLAVRADLPAIRSAAAAAGMRTLSASAADLVAEGLTTPAEAVRVLGEGFWADLKAQAQGTFAEVDEEEAAKPEVDEGLVATPLPTTRRALVLEESGERRAVLGGTLESLDFEVLYASHAEDAAATLAADPSISLLVVDLVEEGRSSREVLHSDYVTLGSYTGPVFLVVGAGDAEVERVLLDHGVQDYVRHPLNPDELKFRLAAVVRRQELVGNAVT